MIFKAGDWKIAGSSGSTLTGGTPIMKVQIGGSLLNIPIINEKTKQKLTLIGAGVGYSAGISLLESPLTDFVNGTLSTSDMPSDGIGSIYRRDNNKIYKPKDFTGLLTVVSGGGGGAGLTGDVSIALWQKTALGDCLSQGWKACDLIKTITSTTLSLNPATLPASFIQSVHAIGFFYGASATTDMLGAGVSAFTYRVII